MSIRSKLMDFFTKGKKKQSPNSSLLTFGGTSDFSSLYGGDPKQLNSTYESCATCLARYVSTVSPKVFYGDEVSETKRTLTRILSLRPNPLQTAADFYYVLAYDYFYSGLAIAHLNYKLGTLVSMTPIDVGSIEVRGQDDDLYLKIQPTDGSNPIYDSVENFLILIRKNNSKNPFLVRDTAIQKVLDVLNTNNESFAKAMVESHALKYIAKLASVTDDTKVAKMREKFKKQLEEDSSGLLIVDGVVNFEKVADQTFVYAKQPEIDEFQAEVYSYFGVTKEFLQGKYTPDEFDSVYHSAMLPLLNLLCQEMTYKLFTDTEIAHGNSIKIPYDKLEYATLQTRISAAQAIQQLSIYRPNDVMRLIGLPPMKNGDVETQSLNYVNSDKADSYQEVGDDKTDTTDDSATDDKDQGDTNK